MAARHQSRDAPPQEPILSKTDSLHMFRRRRRAHLQHRWPERGQRSDELRARPEQLATRDQAIKAALHYPEGLIAAKTFAAVNVPFAPDAYRYENGQVMAGPDCTFAPGCQNISTQSLAVFQQPR